MSKTILLITGSPRRGGNSDMLADAFMLGASKAGHHTEKFEAAFAKINNCRACDTCWSIQKPCTFDDDFNQKFIPLIEVSDTIVFSAPLYFYGFPSGMWSVIEKIYSLLGEGSKIKINIRDAALMMCGGEKNIDVFKGATEIYKQLCKGLNWTNKGIITAAGFLEKGDIAGSGYIDQAEYLGRNI